MNKYQEALERARICGDNDCCDCKFNEICINDKKGWYGTLKELVDKATPKKVFKESLADALCPICHYYINFDMLNDNFKYAPQYCHHCGQALDWSDENDK